MQHAERTADQPRHRLLGPDVASACEHQGVRAGERDEVWAGLASQPRGRVVDREVAAAWCQGQGPAAGVDRAGRRRVDGHRRAVVDALGCRRGAPQHERRRAGDVLAAERVEARCGRDGVPDDRRCGLRAEAAEGVAAVDAGQLGDPSARGGAGGGEQAHRAAQHGPAELVVARRAAQPVDVPALRVPRCPVVLGAPEAQRVDRPAAAVRGLLMGVQVQRAVGCGEQADGMRASDRHGVDRRDVCASVVDPVGVAQVDAQHDGAARLHRSRDHRRPVGPGQQVVGLQRVGVDRLIAGAPCDSVGSGPCPVARADVDAVEQRGRRAGVLHLPQQAQRHRRRAAHLGVEPAGEGARVDSRPRLRVSLAEVDVELVVAGKVGVERHRQQDAGDDGRVGVLFAAHQ